MSRALDDLHQTFRPVAVELLARLTEAQIPVLITCTSRTDAEQAEAIRTGHSKVRRSRHQDGMAIDLVPYALFDRHGPDKLLWDTTDPIWKTIGAIGEGLGLRWGGRFRPVNVIGVGWDPGHFEIPARETTPPPRVLA